MSYRVALPGLAIWCLLLPCLAVAAPPWLNAASMNKVRGEGSSAVVLPNGKILMTGTDASTEIFDPATGKWTLVGSMSAGRVGQTTTLLKDGRVMVAGGSGLHTVEMFDPKTGTWSPGSAMGTVRSLHTATLLLDGRVLAVGGSGDARNAEIWNPRTGGWLPCASMKTPRSWHTATLLRDGRVLAAGGSYSPTAEIYDPVADTWTTVSPMSIDRQEHTATMLPDGRVLVVGGVVGNQNSVEIFNPVNGTWTRTAVPTAMFDHTSTLLPDGRVLVTGGYNSADHTITDTEIYDPATGQWTPSGSLNQVRANHVAVLMPGGQVLVAGGVDYGEHGLGSVEIYVPSGAFSALPDNFFGGVLAPLADGRALATDQTSAGIYDPIANQWTSIATLGQNRQDASPVILRDGRVLLAGGPFDNTAAIYDPAKNTWSATGPMSSQVDVAKTVVLTDGKVMVAGGSDGSDNVLNLTQIYDPATNQWSRGGDMPFAVEFLTLTRLQNGKVLVAGGRDNIHSNPTNVAALYDPACNCWSSVPSMHANRESPSATLLPDGRVLVAGGTDLPGDLSSAETYDPATNSWTLIASMSRPHAGHAAVFLTGGLVLVADGTTSEIFDTASAQWIPGPNMTGGGGYPDAALLRDSSVIVIGGQSGSRFQLYPGINPSWRPVITAVSPVSAGQPIGIEGNLFLGVSEASGGSCQHNSSGNWPMLEVQMLDSWERFVLPADSIAGWSDTTFTSQALPQGLSGPALVRIIVNAIPSIAYPVTIQ